MGLKRLVICSLYPTFVKLLLNMYNNIWIVWHGFFIFSTSQYLIMESPDKFTWKEERSQTVQEKSRIHLAEMPFSPPRETQKKRKDKTFDPEETYKVVISEHQVSSIWRSLNLISHC